MKLIARFIRILLKLFEILPLIGNQIRVININQKINALETQNKLNHPRVVQIDPSSMNMGVDNWE